MLKVIQSKPSLERAFNSLTTKYKYIEDVCPEDVIFCQRISSLTEFDVKRFLGITLQRKNKVVAFGEDWNFSVKPEYTDEIINLLTKASYMSGRNCTVILEEKKNA